jgi:hypothetical protein
MHFLIFVTALTLILGHNEVLRGNAAFVQVRWVLLALLALPFFVRGTRSGPRRAVYGFDRVALTFLCTALLSTLYSIAPDLTWQRSLSLVLLYLAVFWTVWEYADRAGEPATLRPLVSAAGVVFVAGIVVAAANPAVGWQVDGRYRGMLSNPNAVGLLGAIFFPLLLGIILNRRRRLDVFLLVTIFASVVASGSRNGLLCCVVGSVYALLRIRAWRAGFGMLVWSALLYLWVSSGGISPSVEENYALSRLSPTAGVGTGSGRLEAWSVGWPLIRENWVLGHGFGTEDLIFTTVDYDFKEAQGAYLHNSYLGMGYQLGLAGILLFFVPLVVLAFKQLVRTGGVVAARSTLPCEAVLVSGLSACFFESWPYSVGNAFSFPFWISVMLLLRHDVLRRRLASHAGRPLVQRSAPAAPVPALVGRGA